MHRNRRNTLLYGCVQAVYFSWLTLHKVENDMSNSHCFLVLASTNEHESLFRLNSTGMISDA